MMAIDGKMKRDKMKIKGSRRRINLDYLFCFSDSYVNSDHHLLVLRTSKVSLSRLKVIV